MNQNYPNLKKLIDANGIVVGSEEQVKSAISDAELLGEALLGCTINVRGKRYILRMLEIYYGGIGDDSHDWHRTRFEYKKSKYLDHTTIQEAQGFRIYLSSLDTKDSYTRMDIVAGDSGIPLSYLIRSVWDENYNRIGSSKGNPNIVLQEMGIMGSDHGIEISLDQSSDIHLLDTKNEVFQGKNLKVERSKRINLKSDFESKNEILWNLCAVEQGL